MTVQEFINNRNKYKVDYNYQRPKDAWSMEDKQCLIDTILKGEPMPLFFVNYINSQRVYFIVDGQQRLSCIEDFYDNQLKLSEKFSGKLSAGKYFNKGNSLDDNDKYAFLNYELNFHIMEDYDDERVRIIFSRLQRGKPLSLGERLNAKPGSIVNLMRDLAKHPFIEKSTGVAKNRYGVFPDTARILFYEKYGPKQCGSNELYTFFDDFKELDYKSKEYKNAINILNYLEKCFPADPGNYHFLEKHAWVLAVYSMIKQLKFGYALNGKENVIHEFIKDFHSKVYNEGFRKSKVNYQRFYNNVRGGWSEKIINLRRDILVKEFLDKHDLVEKDDKRQISEEEKISVFALQKDCEVCGISFKDYKDAEYHHKEKYSDGGKTSIDNIMILCHHCHTKMHGKINIDVPSEEEIEDDE